MQSERHEAFLLGRVGGQLAALLPGEGLGRSHGESASSVVTPPRVQFFSLVFGVQIYGFPYRLLFKS